MFLGSALPVVAALETPGAALHPHHPADIPERGEPRERSQDYRSYLRSSSGWGHIAITGELGVQLEAQGVPISPEEALSLTEPRHPQETLLMDLIPRELIFSSLTLSSSFHACISGKWWLHVMLSQWRDLYHIFLSTAFSRAESRVSCPSLLSFLIFPGTSLPVFREWRFGNSPWPGVVSFTPWTHTVTWRPYQEMAQDLEPPRERSGVGQPGVSGGCGGILPAPHPCQSFLCREAAP